jgi:hypothetical protein
MEKLALLKGKKVSKYIIHNENIFIGLKENSIYHPLIIFIGCKLYKYKYRMDNTSLRAKLN